MKIYYRCINCNHEFEGRNSDGLRCPNCKGGPIVPAWRNRTIGIMPSPIKLKPQPPKKKDNKLTVTVSIKDTEAFKALLDVIKFLIDNVSEEVRNEALKQIEDIGVTGRGVSNV